MSTENKNYCGSCGFYNRPGDKRCNNCDSNMSLYRTRKPKPKPEKRNQGKHKFKNKPDNHIPYKFS